MPRPRRSSRTRPVCRFLRSRIASIFHPPVAVPCCGPEPRPQGAVQHPYLSRVPLIFIALLSICGFASAANAPTFHKDIEPILQARCQSCHRPGEVAPMSLITYAEARPWAKAIREAVLAGKMPPWTPNPKYGKFRNDLSLTPGEKEKIVAW